MSISNERLRELADENRHFATAKAVVAWNAGEPVRANEVVAMARELLARRAAPQPAPVVGVWQDIETAPRDGTWILGCNNRGNRAVIIWQEAAFYENGRGPYPGWIHPFTHGYLSEFWNGACGSVATHWQPLPTPPALAGEGESAKLVLDPIHVRLLKRGERGGWIGLADEAGMHTAEVVRLGELHRAGSVEPAKGPFPPGPPSPTPYVITKAGLDALRAALAGEGK